MKKLLSMAIVAMIMSSTANAQSDITLNAKVYLKAALSVSFEMDDQGRPLMRDDLREHPTTGATYIPTQDPYSVPTEYTGYITDKYTHVGTGSDFDNTAISNPNFVFNLTGSDAVVDWVFVELRSKWNYTQVIVTRSALIQRDGDIVDLDGESSLVFYDVPEDDYYVAVRHRSHLAIMTANVISIEQMNNGIDLTDPEFDLHDFGASMPGRNYMNMATDFLAVGGQNYRYMWSGDVNADGKVKYDMPMSDLNILNKDVVTHPDNSASDTNFTNVYGYYQGDLDMNGQVKYSDDSNLLFQTIQLYPLNTQGEVNFDFIIAQLPY